MMKIVRYGAILISLASIIVVVFLAVITKRSFNEFDFSIIAEEALYNIDFIKQGIENPNDLLASLEEQSEIIEVGQVVGLKKIKGVLFYEVKKDNNEVFLLFSNGNLSFNNTVLKYQYGTNTYFKPLFIGQSYVFFLQKFTDVTVFTNGQPIYELSQVEQNGLKINQYYTVYNLTENTIILSEYDSTYPPNDQSDYVTGVSFEKVKDVDIYYYRDISEEMKTNYMILKNMVLDKYKGVLR